MSNNFSWSKKDENDNFVTLTRNCSRRNNCSPADVNIQAWPKLIEKTLAKAGWTKNDVDKMFFTQVNLWVIQEVCKILGWDASISHNIMDVYGYTGSACIPMAIDDANRKGLLKPGQKIGVCTSGGGAAFAAMTFIWGK